jgi:endonuclease/exonuclease/phosphatase family metal-dependent hydrolase
MTWNVENHFPAGYRMGSEPLITQGAYQAKLAYLGGRILEVAPDVLALQEIGGEDAADTRALDDLQAQLRGRYPHRSVSLQPDGRGTRVAFLSRLPIQASGEIVHFGAGEFAQVPDWEARPPVTRMERGALWIDVEPVSGEIVRLITLHLMSKLITYPSDSDQPRYMPRNEDEYTRGAGLAQIRRTAEVVTLRAHLNRVMQPGNLRHTIVLGVLNDEPRSATVQIVRGPEDTDASAADSWDTARLYNLVDAIPLRGDDSKGKWFLPAEQRYTRIYRGRRDLIDHILVSKGLLTQTGSQPPQWRVMKVQSLVDSIEGQSVGDNPVERFGEDRPDHAPVYALFDL